MQEPKEKPTAIATVNEKNCIVLTFGPFKDRRAALRKLTSIMGNPKQGAPVKSSVNDLLS
jgi:hypothetical protein